MFDNKQSQARINREHILLLLLLYMCEINNNDKI